MRVTVLRGMYAYSVVFSSLDCRSHPPHVSVDEWVRHRHPHSTTGSDRLSAWPLPVTKVKAGRRSPVQN